MATEITPELRQVVRAAENTPIELVDPETQEQFVLLRADLYARLAAALEQQEVRAMYPGISAAFGPDGWDDPSMDIYNELDPRKQ